MMKRNAFYWVMVTAIFVLVGCAPEVVSPSSGPDVSSANSADVITPMVDPVVVAALPLEESLDQGAVATADLRVPAGYSFNQTYALELAVANQQQRAGYLSVCSDFSQQEQGYVVNYANCQLRVALEGDFAATLDLPNNVSSVLAVVWYFDTDQPADFAVWEKDDALEARFEVVL
ncbi:hypothetical protein OAC77_03210 [Reinekea forsetii]|nr:hypothetical protein [Reinekea forsetii]